MLQLVVLGFWMVFRVHTMCHINCLLVTIIMVNNTGSLSRSPTYMVSLITSQNNMNYEKNFGRQWVGMGCGGVGVVTSAERYSAVQTIKRRQLLIIKLTITRMIFHTKKPERRVARHEQVNDGFLCREFLNLGVSSFKVFTTCSWRFHSCSSTKPPTLTLETSLGSSMKYSSFSPLSDVTDTDRSWKGILSVRS